MDNNPLTYVLTSARLNATGHRWVVELADFKFNINYRPRKSNADADTLWILLLDRENFMGTCTTEVSKAEFKTTINTVQAQSQGTVTWAVAITTDPEVLLHNALLSNKCSTNKTYSVRRMRTNARPSLLTFFGGVNGRISESWPRSTRYHCSTTWMD